MLRIVIAMASDDFGHMLEQQLNTEHSVVRCFDGITAMDLLQHLKPDVLLLDLSLPLMDGLSMLEQTQAYLPGLIVGVTDVTNESVCWQAQELGVSKLYRLPIEPDVFMSQLHDMLSETVPGASPQINMRRRIVQLLNSLSFKPNLSGYQQILVGIPLVMQDISIPMCKELYPKIAELTGLTNSKPIEHTIRTVIRDAWENGDRELWQRYFPSAGNRQKPYPSNKQFFTSVVNILTMR